MPMITEKITQLNTLNKTHEKENKELNGQIEALETHLNNQDAENRRLVLQLEDIQKLKNEFQQSSNVFLMFLKTEISRRSTKSELRSASANKRKPSP